MCRGEGQLFLVRLPGDARVLSRDHGDTARTKSRDQIAIHRVLINVDFDLAHGRRSAAVLLFEGLCLPRFSFQVSVYLCLVGVVVGKGRMHLRQREVPEFSRDFFRNQTHVVPLRDSANRDTRSGNARPAAPNIGTSRD